MVSESKMKAKRWENKRFNQKKMVLKGNKHHENSITEIYSEHYITEIYSEYSITATQVKLNQLLF